MKSFDDLVRSGQLPAGLATARVVVEPPRDPSHGDISTNAAMVLAKDAGQKPRDLPTCSSKPLRGAWALPRPLSQGLASSISRSRPRCSKRVVAEVVAEPVSTSAARLSVQPARSMWNTFRQTRQWPMHVGHCRGAVFGDALANLLAFAGHESPGNTTSTMPAPRSMCSPVCVPAVSRGAGRRDRSDPRGPVSGRLSEAVGR